LTAVTASCRQQRVTNQKRLQSGVVPCHALLRVTPLKREVDGPDWKRFLMRESRSRNLIL